MSEGQAYGGDRLGGDALGAAGEAELLGRRRLDADAAGRDAEDGGDPLDHRRAMGADPGPFADNRDIDRGAGAPPPSAEIGGLAQEMGGAPAAPARVAPRER